MKTIDEIKQMMVAGDAAKAAEALKELLAKEPDNLQAKMLYGTCRQLLGDEETFRHIHDELAPEMSKHVGDPPTTDTTVHTEILSFWTKYHALWMTLIIGGLVLAGGIAVVRYYVRMIYGQTLATPKPICSDPVCRDPRTDPEWRNKYDPIK